MDDQVTEQAIAPPARPRRVQTPINGVVLGFDRGADQGDAHVVHLRIGREIAIWLGLTGSTHRVAMAIEPAEMGRVWLADDGPLVARRLRGGSYTVTIHLRTFDGALWTVWVAEPQLIEICTVLRRSDGGREIGFGIGTKDWVHEEIDKVLAPEIPKPEID